MITRERFENLWYSTKTSDEIMRELGISIYRLWLVKKHFGLPDRPSGPQPNDPDEETIARRCLEVQRKWTDEERERRRAGANLLQTHRLRAVR